MNNIKNKILITALITSFMPNILQARSEIRGVGSSTVYPFVTNVAENFGKKTTYKTPIIESTGTGGGFKLFCAGSGVGFPDISNASRAIKSGERKLCAKNGVKNITEIKIGYDGIVLANYIKSINYKLTIKQIYLALAKEIPANGKFIKNPYKKWSDISKSLPNRKITVYGPPSTSGTRDAFLELVMHKSCMKLKESLAKFPNKRARKKHCSQLREDGSYIDAGENDNLIVHKLKANNNALGIFGFSFLENNANIVKGSTVNSYKPTFDNISVGKYPISRSLFVYVKNSHYNIVKSLKPFVKELISDDAIGSEGYLTYRGLIPLPESELQRIQKNVRKNL
jgi:phosphate transport system substrate-binding protein